jgi:hypothetical protein
METRSKARDADAPLVFSIYSGNGPMNNQTLEIWFLGYHKLSLGCVIIITLHCTDY